MKLLVQSDDYGITRAAAQGILEGIRNGIVRNTGIFINMPWAAECVEWIRPYLGQVALGIDLNAVAGKPVADPAGIPGLIQENGYFLTSGMNRALDNEENHFDHVNYDEIYTEFDAQIQRFIRLTGRKPDYIHGHSYGTPTSNQATIDLAVKYDVPYSVDILYHPGMKQVEFSYYRFGTKLEDQLKDDIKENLLSDRSKILESDYAAVVCHCGYVSMDLFELSTYTLYRAMDLACMTSEEIKNWVRENQIELITYRDLADWRR